MDIVGWEGNGSKRKQKTEVIRKKALLNILFGRAFCDVKIKNLDGIAKYIYNCFI